MMKYDIVTDYINYCSINKRLSRHSIRAYKTDIMQFYNSVYTNLNDYLCINTKKTSTLKRKIASLKTFYKYLEERRLLTENTFIHRKFHFRVDKVLPKIISPEDMKQLYSYLRSEYKHSTTEYRKEKSHRNLLITELLLSTGLRISELCNIQLKNIDMENRSINILGKGNKERVLYIGNDHTYHLLREYVSHYKNLSDKFLFTGKLNNAPLSEQTIRLLFRNISLKLSFNKKVTPHMFRHTFATMLLDNGVDIRFIQHFLGHSSISVTQIYTHVTQNKQQKILKQHNPLNSFL